MYTTLLSCVADPSRSLFPGHTSPRLFSFVRSLTKPCYCTISLLGTSLGKTYHALALLKPLGFTG